MNNSKIVATIGVSALRWSHSTSSTLVRKHINKYVTLVTVDIGGQ